MSKKWKYQINKISAKVNIQNKKCMKDEESTEMILKNWQNK